MIYGVGIDIIEVSRIQKEIENFEDKFLTRIFTRVEIDYCNLKLRRAQHYAARFAAKEAFFKAIGTGWRNGIGWKEIEVVNDELGKPVIRIYGKAKQLVEQNHIANIQLTLSHINDTAIAMVLLEK